MELEEQVKKLAAEVHFLRLLAEKALDVAIDAKALAIKPIRDGLPEDLRKQMHVEQFMQEMAEARGESEEVPQSSTMTKLSPFTLSGFATRRATLKEQTEAIEESVDI